MPATMHCRDLCESNPPVKKHGTGKGLITKDVSVKKHSAGKRLMTEKSVTLRNHGIGKGLMTRNHGMGKGLMTVWRATNPQAGDIPTGVDFGESAEERKKKLLQRQSILVSSCHSFDVYLAICSTCIMRVLQIPFLIL